MKSVRHAAIIGGFVALIMASATGQASACWCNRVYTSYYVDPCVSCCSARVQAYAAPSYSTGCPTSGCPTSGCPTSGCPTSGCPTTSCYTSSAQRCYLEPQVEYRTISRLEPQTFYVRRSYYDPYSCCHRSYYSPATQYVEHSYQVPVTNYVQRCYVEPSTVCTTSYSEPTTNGTSTAPNADTQPAERLKTDQLQRPVHREPAQQTEPPPKPKPMPAPMPESVREGSASLNNSRRTNYSGTRAATNPASLPPVYVSLPGRSGPRP